MACERAICAKSGGCSQKKICAKGGPCQKAIIGKTSSTKDVLDLTIGEVIDILTGRA